jgi:16S rRNA (guanine527-N7)-methyltransferase
MRNPGRSGSKPAGLLPGHDTGRRKPSTMAIAAKKEKAHSHSVRSLSRSASWPEEARAALAAALAELRLQLDERACASLLDYLAQLQKWNAVYNLTAIRDPREMLVQHLFDCLAIIAPLRERGLLGKDAVVLDVGSGGGLPGALIAIVEPGAQVHCVDTVSKKAAFIAQLRAELSLPNLHAHHARVEELVCPDDMPAASLIVSRAFSSLAQFVGCSAHLLAPGGAWAAMKGRLPDDELAELPADVQVATPITLRVPKLDAVRHLLILRRGGSPV